MKLVDFDFDLPEALIAQEPIKDRIKSRLLVLNKFSGKREHRIFKEIIHYLSPGDCLVLNNTKVIPARLLGHRLKTQAKIEMMLLKPTETDIWEVLVKPGKRVQIGDEVSFGNGRLIAKIVNNTDFGGRIVKFFYNAASFEEILDGLGEMPTPPYIKKKLQDKGRYQTVYAQTLGSVAAPTAGFHFTKELLERIKGKGVSTAFITLHVGLGTFRPIKADNIEEHKMHAEYYEISAETAEIINFSKQNGGKIFAVGTTTTRTLETVAKANGEIRPCKGWSDIFIYPGYDFKIVDALITNFHLPKSTLVLLVCAFAGRENVIRSYKEAVNEKYKFFSFGDAMLIM